MANIKKNEIIEFLSSHRAELERRFGVKKIGLFGSASRGDAGKESDIDIAVELVGDNIADSYFGLLHFLEDTFQRRIDLGIESNLKPAVRERIKREIQYV